MSNTENIKSREFIFFWPILSMEHKLGRDKSSEQMLAGGEQISLEYRLQWEKWKLFCSNCPKEALMGGGGNINYARTTFCRCLGRRKCWWAVAIFCISAKYSQIFENIYIPHCDKYFASQQNILTFFLHILHLAKYLAKMFLIVEQFSL